MTLEGRKVVHGNNLLLNEAIARSFDDLRRKLAAEETSSLDSILVDRVCLDWTSVSAGPCLWRRCER